MFIIPWGHSKYWVMPYGLANTSLVFQGFMDEVLQDMLQRFVIIYIDDILIYSQNLANIASKFHCRSFNASETTNST